MPLTSYPCIYGATGEIKYLKVFRGDGTPINVYPLSEWTFNSADIAASASGGLFDADTTFVTYGYQNSHTNLTSRGLTDIYPVGSYGDFGSHEFIFNGNRRVTFTYSGNTGPQFCDIVIRYTMNGKTISTTAAHRDRNFIYSAVGLMSERVYEITANGSTYSCLLNPVITPSRIGLGYSYDVHSPLSYFYPSYGNFTSGEYVSYTNQSDSNENFDKAVRFFTDFWHGIRLLYTGMMTIGVGGIATPANFVASVNEPRMFTVTPDQHHAIHSVTAYNTTTNTQIPLQESAMDLLTGAKSYMFTMPTANVRIIVEFRSIEITIPVTVSYTSPKGRTFTTSFNLLYDDSEQREETQNE